MINEHDIEAFQRFQPLEDVVEMHKVFGHPINKKVTKDSVEELWFRWKLIKEEFDEVTAEIQALDRNPEDKVALENLLKELADLQYVLAGMCATFGLDLYIAFKRVHDSNMSKLGLDGKPVLRADGKIQKGPNYKKPDLKDLI